MPTNTLATNVVQTVITAASTNAKDPAWLQALNSNLVAAIVGFASALLIWKLSEWSQARQKKDEDKARYLSLLRAIEAELRFYKGKLDGLSKHCGNAIEAIQTQRMVIRPSYSLYPMFLERSKQELCGYFKNEELVKELAHYHFELCHIRRVVLQHCKEIERAKNCRRMGIETSHGRDTGCSYSKLELGTATKIRSRISKEFSRRCSLLV